MKTTADVIVVGGGITGNAIAYYMVKKGYSVIVLEGDDSIGHGGSSRNGGGVRQSGRDPRELPVAMYGIKNIWPTLSEETGVNVEYCQGGNLRLGKTEEHIKILQGLTDRAAAVGLQVDMIDGKQVREICPYFSEAVIGASWCPTDGHANPMKATLAYYKRARELGVQYISGDPVVKLGLYKGEIRKVYTQSGAVYEGSKVAVCAGLESRKIIDTVGVDLPMNPYVGEALVTEMQPKMFDIMIGTAMADFYGHQCEHGSFVFGSGSGLEPFSPPDSIRTTSLTMDAACRAIMGYIPALADAKIVRSWAGLMDMTPDHVAIVSAIDEIPGLYTISGTCGHAFGAGPGYAYCLAEIMDGKESPADISGLHYNRFKSNK